MAKHPIPEGTKEAIATALKQDTRQEFLQALSKKGITAMFYENAAGVIYGVTYIDHTSRTVFKGSALGKEYSASVINRQYGVVLSGKEEEVPVLHPTEPETKNRDWWKECWTSSHRNPILIRQKICPKPLRKKKRESAKVRISANTMYHY